MHNHTGLCREVQMSKEEDLINAVLESASGGQEIDDRKKLACAEAFELAQEFEVEVIEIGRICNRNNIRVCKCQLGCFA